MSIVTATWQYVTNPIKCWVPAQWTKYWTEYAYDYCFVENTYWVPFYEKMPRTISDREKREITYYQWVPFILVLMAFLFCIPHVIWRIMNWQSGLNVKNILNTACDSSIHKEQRDKDIATIATHIERAISLPNAPRGRNPVNWFFQCGRGYAVGAYITILYIIVKILFIVNLIGQFLLLNRFLGPQYKWWGAGILRDLVNGTQWHTSGHFPRVTLCDVPIRDLGDHFSETGQLQQKTWTIQCVLWTNMLNEKVFIFLWFWFFLIAILTILNLWYWVVASLFFGVRKSFIAKYLLRRGLLDRDASLLDIFVSDKLRTDGVFVLRLMANNAGDLIVTDVLEKMWKDFVAEHKRKSQSSDGEFREVRDEREPEKKPLI